MLMKISVRDLCLFSLVSRHEGHPVVSSASITLRRNARRFVQLHGSI